MTADIIVLVSLPIILTIFAASAYLVNYYQNIDQSWRLRHRLFGHRFVLVHSRSIHQVLTLNGEDYFVAASGKWCWIHEDGDRLRDESDLSPTPLMWLTPLNDDDRETL